MFILILALASMVTFKATAHTETAQGSLVVHHSVCEESLSPNASLQLVQPWFHPGNPSTQNLSLTFMRHKFAQAFTFSKDGRYVMIHHNIYPDAEQLTLRSLESGEKLSSLLWRGKDEKLFDLRSADFKGQTGEIVGMGDNFFSNNTDSVALWQGTGPVQHVEIAPPRDQDYASVKAYGNNHSFKTPISVRNPYYVRTQLRSKGLGFDSGDREYSAQLVNWRKNRVLNLPDTALDYLNVAPTPISERFGFLVYLKSDRVTVQLAAFEDLESEMSRQANPPPLWARLKLWGRPPHASKIDAKAAPFNWGLKHDEPVLKLALSQWAPFVVTQTKSGLHIWNARSGVEIGTIVSAIENFRVLDKMSLLVFTDQSKNVIFYSLYTGQEVGRLANFSRNALRSRLENYQLGVGLITLDNNEVFMVHEVPVPGGQPVYKFYSTDIHLPKSNSQSYVTEIATSKARYLAHVTRATGDETKLKLTFYALDGSGQPILNVEVSMRAFQAQFEIDPSGYKIIYTDDETQTGILHLDRILQERGF